MASNGATLTPRQVIFCAALAAGMNKLQAARQAGISQRQSCRWLKMPVVLAEIARLRGEVLREATNKAVNYAIDALITLHDLTMDSDVSASARVNAAGKIIDAAGKFVETNDLAERVEELEEALHATKDTD